MDMASPRGATAPKKNYPEKFKEISKKLKANQRKKDPQKFKEINKKLKANQRKNDPEKLKEIDKKSKANQRKAYPERSKEIDKKSKTNQRKANPERSKEIDKKSKVKQRACKNELDRLRKFREATKYGPIFICVSCHIKCFKTNVQPFNRNLIHEKWKNCINNVIEDELLFTNIQTKNSNMTNQKESNGKQDEKQVFICKTCVRYLKKGSIPPSSVKNSLKLKETDNRIRKQDLVFQNLKVL